jgi:hypothetical protein
LPGSAEKQKRARGRWALSANTPPIKKTKAVPSPGASFLAREQFPTAKAMRFEATAGVDVGI